MDFGPVYETCARQQLWSFFCRARLLRPSNLYGEEYERLYERLEEQGLYHSQMKAQDLWLAICNSQIESTPYLLYKDAVNRKSIKNVGVIKSAIYAGNCAVHLAGEVSVCNLASIALPTFVMTTVISINSMRWSKRLPPI